MVFPSVRVVAFYDATGRDVGWEREGIATSHPHHSCAHAPCRLLMPASSCHARYGTSGGQGLGWSILRIVCGCLIMTSLPGPSPKLSNRYGLWQVKGQDQGLNQENLHGVWHLTHMPLSGQKGKGWGGYIEEGAVGKCVCYCLLLLCLIVGFLLL